MTRNFLSTWMQGRPFGCGAKSRFAANSSAWAAKRVGAGSGSLCRQKNGRSESGVTLLETMIAALVLIIVITGILPVFLVGFQTTEQQGDIATRTTEYAQDKMESLMNLSFTDSLTDTTVYPAAASGGTGLGGAMAASATVGSIPPTAAATGYVDYLDYNGGLLANSTGAYYSRQWKITTDSTATLKTITIVASALQRTGMKGLAPTTTLVCIKSSGL